MLNQLTSMNNNIFEPYLGHRISATLLEITTTALLASKKRPFEDFLPPLSETPNIFQMVHLFGEALAESGPKALSAPQVIEQKSVEPIKPNQFRMQETLNL